jgi:zinc protease
VDKEMTTFTASTHIDNLEAFYGLFREMLLEPGWRADDFSRLRDDQINYLRVSLRGNNDEELGKEVLYERIYAGHPYGHVNQGHVSDLQKLNIDDLQQFYKNNYTQANLIVGIAGGYPAEFAARIRKDFGKLEKGGAAATLRLPAPKPIEGLQMTLVEKNTRSVAFSLGHPIAVRRGDPDYPALLLVQSYFGQHRNSSGRLYNRIRELRGINYGDYAYIEYFPSGMFRFEPEPNLVRQQQIFQIWIRPVEPPNAHFTLRLAMYEFNRLVREGIPQDDFDRTRNFLSKYVNLLLKTKSAELGYAIDSKVYGIGSYAEYLKSALAKLTRDDVNRAIRRHLHPDNLQIVVIGQGMEAFRAKLLANEPSPMKYNAPKPDEVTAEDKVVQALQLAFKPEDARIVPVQGIFE